MADIEVVARKWGDSVAVILPNEFVKAEKIKLGQKIHISIHHKVDFSDVFGKWKPKKTTQEIIDEEKKGWM